MDFKRLRVEEGLHNSIVYRILQDRSGQIWFALHDGIDRYNGYDFKHFSLDTYDESNNFINSQVRSYSWANDKEFWISSGSSIFKYNLQKDKFEAVITRLSSDQEVNQIQDIYISPDSICYIATNQGLFAYDIRTDSLSDFTNLTVSILSIEPVDGLLWLATGSGIRHFNPSINALVQITRDEILRDSLQSLIGMCFFTDSTGIYTLIGTRTNGIFKFDHRQLKLKKIIHPFSEYLNIRAIERYGERYLIGMDGNGLAILDKDFKLIAHYKHDEDNNRSLSSNGIYDIHVDPGNRIWISTYGGGVNVFDPNVKAFNIYRHESNNNQSLRNNVSRCFLEYEGNMLFGTASGMSMLDAEGKWRHVPWLNARYDPPVILDMIADQSGRIWLGTFGRGIEIWDPEIGRKKRIHAGTDSSPVLTTNYIYVMHQDSKENIWIGGIRGGLMRYEAPSNSIDVFSTIQNVHSIIEAHNGDILVGTLDGVEIIRKIDGEYTLTANVDTVLTGLKMRAYCLYERNPGEIWIGTEGSGLFTYSRTAGTYSQVTEDDGVPSNIVYGILEDAQTNLWLSTTAGLVKYNPASGKISTYTRTDGISGKDFNYGAYYQSSNGIMYFGSQNGVTWFRPEEIKEDQRLPDVILTNLSILGFEETDPENPAFDLNINETDVLALQPDENSFSIEFAAINYTASTKNLYQWKISGGDFGDGIWTPPSTDRRAVFSFLPPGNYDFTVIASNSDGYWNKRGKTINIQISPPIWNTLLAKIIYALMVVMLFIALQRYIFTFIRERQAKEKIRFFINIAHDIRTPLTLISAPISKLLHSEKLNWEEKEEVRVAAKNSERLKSLLNQLLEFQKASLNRQVLKVTETDVSLLVQEVMNNFQPLMDERMINITRDQDSSPMMAWIDRQKIEKILYNLISNAIKYSDKGGFIHISIRQQVRRIAISVKDDGKGIPAKQQKDIFKRYFRAQNTINSRETGSGVGLMLSKKLIELHHGSIRFTSTENLGSEFIIDFPWQRSAYSDHEILEPEHAEIQNTELEGDTEELTFSREYTVLVVEDNQELLQHISNSLKDQYNVLTAKNGQVAYRTIIKLDVDLIVSDVMMPEMDGRVLCQKVRSNIATSHIPIILLTALNSMQDKIDGLEHGADAYIEKPFEMEHLKIRIANMIKSRERLKQRFLDEPDRRTEEEISHKPDQELMGKLNSVVSERVLNEEFSVVDMCRLFGMSRPVLYRKLKAYTGHSPQEYLLIMRLNHAIKLFRNGKLSIKEVAYESGFSDPKHFSRSFKKYHGLSPTAFIESNTD